MAQHRIDASGSTSTVALLLSVALVAPPLLGQGQPDLAQPP
jgi:hypothetical protein